MTDPCSFSACEDEATQRVIVTAAEASSWALRPSLLEQVDRDLGTDGARAAIGLMFCPDHALGVDREHYRARTAKLTPNESKVLRYLEGQAFAGGATVEAVAGKLRIAESSVKTMIRRLTDAGAVHKSRYQGYDRGRHRVPKYLARGENHEPPATQPSLLGE